MDIPLSARIFAVVDVFDALRSKRPYKEPYSYEESHRIILDGAGTHFDPDIVAVFQAQPRSVWDALGQGGCELGSMDEALRFVGELTVDPEARTVR